MALVPEPPSLVPGSLDYRAYEAERGVYYRATIAPSEWRRTETGAGNFWRSLSYRARDWAYARLQLGLEDDPRVADFLAGMLIGYRQEIRPTSSRISAAPARSTSSPSAARTSPS